MLIKGALVAIAVAVIWVPYHYFQPLQIDWQWLRQRTITWVYSGLILGLRPANERRRYKVTPSPIGWAQTLNQPCIFVQAIDIFVLYFSMHCTDLHFNKKTAERHILLIQYILFKYYVPWRLLFSSIYTEKVHCCVGTSLHGTMMGLLLTDSKHVPEVISLRYPFWKKKKIIQFRMLTILYCGRVTELMPNHRGCPVPFTI